jgi:hypothetical protein
MIQPEFSSLTKVMPFEPDDALLSAMAKEDQIDVMRRWFLERYENPVNETPWDSEDSAYVFVWGGPYDPDTELQERFGALVDFEVIAEVVNELVREVGDEWAPIQHEGVDYEDYLTHFSVNSRKDPYDFYFQRCEDIFSTLNSLPSGSVNQSLLNQMVHGTLIATLEAYLADTAKYWIQNNSDVLKKFVSTNKDFQVKTLKVSEIFSRFEKIADELNLYLSELVWHRLDKVKPMLALGLGIEVPSVDQIMKQVKVRHDIVHRAGRREDGSLVQISREDLLSLRLVIDDFIKSIEDELIRRFPPTSFDVEQLPF